MSATPQAMPNVTERTPQPARPPQGTQPQAVQPLRLMLPAANAAKQVTPWVTKGIAIRKCRVRDLPDLDKARAEKKAWVQGYTESLSRMFDGTAVAEACNDWISRILPDYAPLGLFVEQFYEEMDHRLRRLQAVVDHLEDMAIEDSAGGEAAGVTDAGKGAAGGTGTSPAKKDEYKGKSTNWARLFPTIEELSGRTSDDAAANGQKPALGGAAGNGKAQGAQGHAAPGTLLPVVKPVGLLLVQSADDAKAVSELLTDLAVTPRVMVRGDTNPADPEALMSGATPPGFALVWPAQSDQPTDAASAARSQFQLGFLVGRLGLSRVCLVQPAGKPTPADCGPVGTITLDAHGGWQLPLARTLKRAGVQVDLNRLV